MNLLGEVTTNLIVARAVNRMCACYVGKPPNNNQLTCLSLRAHAELLRVKLSSYCLASSGLVMETSLFRRPNY